MSSRSSRSGSVDGWARTTATAAASTTAVRNRRTMLKSLIVLPHERPVKLESPRQENGMSRLISPRLCLEAAQRAAATTPPTAAPIVRDSERYFFSVFGTPSGKDTWGWRVEGHHVSLHFTVVNGALVAGAPAFFGSNPAEVREGAKKGLRILGAEEDAARALLDSLDQSQRAKAIIETAAPGDMLTMANVDIKPLSPAGITAEALKPNQRDLLMKLIDVYIGFMAPDIAADRTAKLKKAGVEKIGFAWAGEAERGKKHYYRVQGPSFLIEYDNTQNDGNHIHSVWRDFDGDFGRDLLREHLKSTPH